jgi:hypothetical protein
MSEREGESTGGSTPRRETKEQTKIPELEERNFAGKFWKRQERGRQQIEDKKQEEEHRLSASRKRSDSGGVPISVPSLPLHAIPSHEPSHRPRYADSQPKDPTPTPTLAPSCAAGVSGGLEERDKNASGNYHEVKENERGRGGSVLQSDRKSESSGSNPSSSRGREAWRSRQSCSRSVS